MFRIYIGKLLIQMWEIFKILIKSGSFRRNFRAHFREPPWRSFSVCVSLYVRQKKKKKKNVLFPETSQYFLGLVGIQNFFFFHTGKA